MADQRRISEIFKVVEEKLELKFYDEKRGGQYQILSINGKEVPQKYTLLISFDKKTPVLDAKENMKQDGAAETKENLDPNQYYGEINVFLCKKKLSLIKKDSLEMIRHIRKLYTVGQWKEQSKKIKVSDILK